MVSIPTKTREKHPHIKKLWLMNRGFPLLVGVPCFSATFRGEHPINKLGLINPGSTLLVGFDFTQKLLNQSAVDGLVNKTHQKPLESFATGQLSVVKQAKLHQHTFDMRLVLTCNLAVAQSRDHQEAASTTQIMSK